MIVDSAIDRQIIADLRAEVAKLERERDEMRNRWQRMSDLAGHNLDEREKLLAERDAAFSGDA